MKVKKLFFTVVTLLAAAAVMGQAKKPTIMVVPSDIWCIQNGFVDEFDDQGESRKIPDYKEALQNNSDIRVLISKMGDIMAQRDFPMKVLEQELKRLENESVETSLLLGKETGAGIAENAIERLNRTAKADILIDLAFEVKRQGPRRQVTFNVSAYDAYTSKLISGNTGVSSLSSSAPIETLLEEVVLSFMDNFTAGLQRHFDDMFANGREITVSLRRFDSAPIDFESEFDYNGQYAELADIIGVWFEDNCVEGRFSESSRSANLLRYEQVRMPLYGTSLSGRTVAIDATAFVRSLADMLKRDPYSVPVKTYQKGLGEVWLILGDK